MIKKILSVVLSMTICFSIVPCCVCADEMLLINQYEDNIEKVTYLLDDSKQYANEVVQDWLDNKSGKYYFSDFVLDTETSRFDGDAYSYFEDDSHEFDEEGIKYNVTDESVRMAKDNLYILSLAVQYLTNYTYDINHDEILILDEYYQDYVDDIRCILDHLMTMKDNLLQLFNCIEAKDYNSDETFIETFCTISKDILQTIYDTYSPYDVDLTDFFNDMKKDVANAMENDSYNLYSKYETVFTGFIKQTLNPLGLETLDSNYDKLLNNLDNYDFDISNITKIYNNITDKYADETGVYIEDQKTKEEYINETYYFLMEAFYSYIEKFTVGIECENDRGTKIEKIRCILNNCGPLLYKLLDCFEAIEISDEPNIYILCGEIIEDLNNLFNLTFENMDETTYGYSCKKEYAKDFGRLRLYAANELLGNSRTTKDLNSYLKEIDEANINKDVIDICSDGIKVINTIVNDNLSGVDINVNLLNAGRNIEKTYEDVTIDCYDNNNKSINSSIEKFIKDNYKNKNKAYVFNIDAKQVSKYEKDKDIYDYGKNNTLEIELKLKKEYKNLTLLRYYNGQISEIPFGYENRNINSEYYEIKDGNVIAHLRYLGTYSIAYKKKPSINDTYVAPKTGIK